MVRNGRHRRAKGGNVTAIRFSAYNGVDRCVECLIRMQCVRERAEFLQSHGCEISISQGLPPKATWLVFLHSGAQAGNATPMCRHCAQAYLSNAIENNRPFKTPHGLNSLPEDGADFSQLVPLKHGQLNLEDI